MSMTLLVPGDLVVVTDTKGVDARIEVGDTGKIVRDNGVSFLVEIQKLTNNISDWFHYNQLKKAIRQMEETLPVGRYWSSGDAVALDTRDEEPPKPKTEKEKQKDFFFPDRHRDLRPIDRDRVKEGRCPKCGTLGRFSHFAYVCPEHGEF